LFRAATRDISVTTDGGKNWTDIQPSDLTSPQFSTPFQMDPNDANHLMIGGRDVEETGSGPSTTSSTWSKVYDLGTRDHPGDAAAASSSADPDNQLSAVDTLSYPAGSGAPTGPKTAVRGHASSEGPGMELVQARFQPSGA